MEPSDNKNLIIASAGSVILSLLLWITFTYLLPDNRLVVLLGGNVTSGGYIQTLTYLCFIWSMLEISQRLSKVDHEYGGFKKGILPTKEHFVLNPEDLNELRLRIIEIEKGGKYQLSSLALKAITKFIRTGSVAEMQELISSQAKINQAHSESQQSIIRYLLWALPSLGFIGTVIGISQALTIAGDITDGNTKVVTDTLGVAFDTTLVALVLSTFSMWFYTKLQAKDEQLHADMEEYAINNLVNRIDTRND